MTRLIESEFLSKSATVDNEAALYLSVVNLFFFLIKRTFSVNPGSVFSVRHSMSLIMTVSFSIYSN